MKLKTPVISLITEQNYAFAESELKKYLTQAFESSSPSSGAGCDFYIGSPSWCARNAGASVDASQLKWDGFYLKISQNRCVISGLNECALLYGVYEFLRRMGYRWFYPGRSGEYVPKSETGFELPDGEWISNPDFEMRSFTEGSHKKPASIWTDEMRELIDWSAKNKINSIFFHNDPAERLEGFAELVPELRKRGIIIEWGGHGVQNFVDRELFESKPYLFREKDGERRKDGNFCASSPEALEMVLSKVKGVLEQNDFIDILHLWFDDVAGGSWCTCEKCKDRSPAEQLAGVIVHIARDLQKTWPNVMIDTLLYHDSLEISTVPFEMPDNVIGYFAPRERCYSHGIADTSCARNAEYHGYLTDTFEKFKTNTYIFEYYDDMILFVKMKANFPDVIRRDMEGYKAAGVTKITSLMFGRYSWMAYEFNMYAFAEFCWDMRRGCDSLLDDLCSHLYPVCGKTMKEYYKKLEEASYKLLTFCGYHGDVNDIRNLSVKPVEFFREHTSNITEANKLHTECAELVQDCLGSCKHDETEKARLEDQAFMMDITAKESEAIMRQMTARLMKAEGSEDKEQMAAIIQGAIDLEAAMEEWSKTIPAGRLGVAGGESIFTQHLCNDMKRIYMHMMRRVTS